MRPSALLALPLAQRLDKRIEDVVSPEEAMGTDQNVERDERTAAVTNSRRRVLAVVLGVVLLNVAINARSVVRHWPELTFLHYLIGTALWLLLPLVAVSLLYRGKRAGRWILVALFGLRAVAGLICAAWWMPLVVRNPSKVFVSPYRDWTIDALFYLIATLWLVFLRRVREISL